MKLKKLLTKKYGTPKEDKEFWSNDLYRDDLDHWGMAIAVGHLSYYATWETEKTAVEISLTGDNYKVTHKVLYQSRKLAELREADREAKQLEEL